MATSGTYNWLPSVDLLLVEAWERCGKSGEIMNGPIVSAALRSLQFLLLHWQNLGPRLWTIEKISFSAVPGVAEYQMPPATMDALEGGITIGVQDIPMAPIGRDEYAMIADKTTQAQPTQYWVQRGLPLPQVTLYPTPNLDYTVWFNRIRQPQDVTALMQEPEIPAAWADAVAAELARRLSVKFAPDRLAALTEDAQRAYNGAMRESRERVPLTVRISRR